MLRQELRDRFDKTIIDNNNRLRNLEDRYDEMEIKVVEKSEIEAIIEKRFDQFGSGLTLTDVKQKMLNLKVRAQPNQKGFSNGEINQPTEIEQLKLDMLKEVRKMREDLKTAFAANQDCITELQRIHKEQKTEEKPEEKTHEEKASAVGIGGTT